MDEETLKKQKVLYKLFNNSISNNRLANSYLLYGDLNAPLKETALYLAKSLSCEKNTFACNNCNSCLRFDKGKALDSYFIDGSVESIKKENIKNLEKHFKYSTLETNHTSTYVIHLINNITEEAANALLKFLEEPKYKLIAFLTTHNVDQTLKTIVSRSTLVKVESVNQHELYLDLLNVDIGKNKLSDFAAYILSNIVPSISEANLLLENKNILIVLDEIEQFINELSINPKNASYKLLSIPQIIKDTKAYPYLILSLSIIFSEMLSNKINDDLILKKELKSINISKSKIGKIKRVLEEYNSFKNLNLNINYYLSKIILLLLEENK